MDSRRHSEEQGPTQEQGPTDGAVDFVRFCHRRKRVGWPELYDEMCHVASRGLYHGWGFGELAEHGIAFGLSEMPRLAGLVAEVVSHDVERRPRLVVGVMAPEVQGGRAEAREMPEEALHSGVFVGAAR